MDKLQGKIIMKSNFKYIDRYVEANDKANPSPAVEQEKPSTQTGKGQRSSNNGIINTSLRTSATGENFTRVYQDTYGTNSVKVLWFKLKGSEEGRDLKAAMEELVKDLNGKTYSYNENGVFEKYKLVVIDQEYDSKNDAAGLVIRKQYLGRAMGKTLGTAAAVAGLGAAGAIATGYNKTKPSNVIR